MTWRCPLALAIGLAACSPFPDAAPPPATPALPAPPPASAAPPVPPRKPPLPSLSRPAAKPSAPSAPSANPDELMGLDEGEVRKLLGSPAEARDDGPARILSYRTRACSLDVIFFMDVKAGALRVASYELDPTSQAAKACYNDELRGTR